MNQIQWTGLSLWSRGMNVVYLPAVSGAVLSSVSQRLNPPQDGARQRRMWYPLQTQRAIPMYTKTP
jgi:hypothetical protein